MIFHLKNRFKLDIKKVINRRFRLFGAYFLTMGEILLFNGKVTTMRD